MKINHYIVGFTLYNALILLNIQRPRVHHGQWMQESTGMTFRDIFTSHRVFPVQAEGFNRVRIFRGHATVTVINGDSYVIAWHDEDTTDTVKTLKEMKRLYDE